jgi:hypothetical protein
LYLIFNRWWLFDFFEKLESMHGCETNFSERLHGDRFSSIAPFEAGVFFESTISDDNSDERHSNAFSFHIASA